VVYTVHTEGKGSQDLCALTVSVLGRDILVMFAVIVDRRDRVVAIIGGQHQYMIQPPQPQ
jgi:hypothetical protein